MPAATDLAPSRTIAWASTVAVVVPSPAVSDVRVATSRTSWAPMFSNLSESSISLATVTPSLVMRGAPYDLSSRTLRPLGPSVTFTEFGQDVDAAQHAGAGVAAETYFFSCHGRCSLFLGIGSGASCHAAFLRTAAAPSITPITSDSLMIRRSSPSILTSLPDHLPNRMRSPFLTSSGTRTPLSSRAPGPTATISPSVGFSLAVSGMMMPP